MAPQTTDDEIAVALRKHGFSVYPGQGEAVCSAGAALAGFGSWLGSDWVGLRTWDHQQ